MSESGVTESVFAFFDFSIFSFRDFLVVDCAGFGVYCGAV